MNLSGNSLSEILTRSKRLEQVLPFRTQLTVPTILQRSRNISRTTNDNRVGYLLLAQQHVDIENAREILNSITNPRIISDNYISFQDRSNFAYQDVIVKSIDKVQKSTEKLDDDLIYQAFKQRQLLSSRTITDQSISVPIHNLDPIRLRIYGDGLRMELVERSKFYCRLLPHFHEDMARTISDAILSSSDKLNNYESQYFADTFRLIHYIKRYGNVIEGASAFLENQKKRLIVNETNSNLRYLERGGEIGIIKTIEAYLRYRKNKHSESPYATIFYAIRCGELKAASDYAKDKIHQDVAKALEYYSNRIPLTGSLKDTLVRYLNTEFQSTRFDLFKVLTLSLLTKTRRKIESGKNIKIQDWLWFELQFTTDIRSFVDQLGSVDQFNYPDLQGQILMIIGSFDEAARWFLAQSEISNLQDNLHIVLCLHVSEFISSDLLLEPLIKYAIEVFKTDQESAIRYLSLIREHDKRIDSISKLAIKTDKGYQMFESRIKLDRTDTTPPIMNVLLPDEANEVIEKASIESRRLDLYDITIKLYLLRGDYMGILTYDCIKLQQIIKNFSNNEMLNIINQHYALIQEEQKNGSEAGGIIQNSVDFNSLIIMRDLFNLASACEFVRCGDYVNAVTAFEDTDLFPPSGMSVDSMHQTFLNMPEIIREVIPFVLVPALEAYYNIFLSTLNDANSSNREKSREKSEAIKKYASIMDLDSRTQALIWNLCSSIK